MDYEKSRRFSSIIKCSPIRFDSFFVAIDTKAWMVVVETFSVMVSKYLRVRMRAIQGTELTVVLRLFPFLYEYNKVCPTHVQRCYISYIDFVRLILKLVSFSKIMFITTVTYFFYTQKTQDRGLRLYMV